MQLARRGSAPSLEDNEAAADADQDDRGAPADAEAEASQDADCVSDDLEELNESCDGQEQDGAADSPHDSDTSMLRAPTLRLGGQSQQDVGKARRMRRMRRASIPKVTTFWVRGLLGQTLTIPFQTVNVLVLGWVGSTEITKTLAIQLNLQPKMM